MPQLDLSAFPPQIIWLVITFLTLWLLMAKIALPRIGGVLEERQKKISDNLEMAESLRKAAQAELENYEKAIAEANDQARLVIVEATQQITQDSATQTAELRATLAKKIKEAEANITLAKETAMESIRYSAAEVASAASERLIGAPISKEKLDATIDDIIKNGGL